MDMQRRLYMMNWMETLPFLNDPVLLMNPRNDTMHKFSSLCITLAFVTAFFGREIHGLEYLTSPMSTDETPVQYYRRIFTLGDDDQIIQFRVDIDQDGTDELFLAGSERPADRTGKAWVPFVLLGGRWVPGVREEIKAKNNNAAAVFLFPLESALVVDLGKLGMGDTWGLATVGGRIPYVVTLQKVGDSVFKEKIFKSSDDDGKTVNHEIAVVAYGLVWEMRYGKEKKVSIKVEAANEP